MPAGSRPAHPAPARCRPATHSPGPAALHVLGPAASAPARSCPPDGVGNVLSDRRLRSPPDHWGRTSVTWRTSQSWAHMYVPDPPPPSIPPTCWPSRPDDIVTSTSIPSFGREAGFQWSLRDPQRSTPAFRLRRVHTHGALRSSCPDPRGKTRCMSPIAATASRPAPICPLTRDSLVGFR